MSADFRRILDAMGGSLMAGSALTLEHDYQQRSAFVLGMLVAMAAEQADGAVEALVTENAALRALFADAAAGLADSALAARLGDAAAARDESLRMSALATANRALRMLLIELHAHVETLAGDEARRLEERIWSELVAGNARRRLASSPM